MKISVVAMAAACSLLYVTTANAADAEIASAAEGWSGFYVGAYGGYGGAAFDGATDTNELLDPEDPQPEDATWMSGEIQWGLTYGGYAGFNIDNGGLVFGLEADFGGADFSETANDEDAEEIDTHEVNWIGTFRGRFGGSYENTLIYMTGGLALAGSTFEAIENCEPVCEDTGSKDLLSFGYVVGAGLEHRFHENVSMRLEGLYYGSMNEHTFEEDELHGDIDSGDYAKIDGMMQFRAGIGYHF
jgi:outer membrane immunogenic protein